MLPQKLSPKAKQQATRPKTPSWNMTKAKQQWEEEMERLNSKYNLDCYSNLELDSESDEGEQYHYKHGYEILISKKCKNEFVRLILQKYHFQKPTCWLNFQNISKPKSLIHVWLTIGILFILVCASYKFIDPKMFNWNTPLLRILLSKSSV